MTHILADLKIFLETAPTSWHATQEIGNRLAIHHFLPLEDTDKWKLKPGGKYFITKGGSLCAFSLPKKNLNTRLFLLRIQIAALLSSSHFPAIPNKI